MLAHKEGMNNLNNIFYCLRKFFKMTQSARRAVSIQLQTAFQNPSASLRMSHERRAHLGKDTVFPLVPLTPPLIKKKKL